MIKPTGSEVQKQRESLGTHARDLCRCIGFALGRPYPNGKRNKVIEEALMRVEPSGILDAVAYAIAWREKNRLNGDECAGVLVNKLKQSLQERLVPTAAETLAHVVAQAKGGRG
jgi:hypothetical protein